MNAGDAAQTQCVVLKGDLPINISWSFHGDMNAFRSGVVTSSIGSRGSALIIDSLSARHAGTYTCTARNQVATVTYSTVLVVNGREDCVRTVFIPSSRSLNIPSEKIPTALGRNEF